MPSFSDHDGIKAIRPITDAIVKVFQQCRVHLVKSFMRRRLQIWVGAFVLRSPIAQSSIFWCVLVSIFIAWSKSMAYAIPIFLGAMLNQSCETAVSPKIFLVAITICASQLVLNNCLAEATLKVLKSKNPRPEKRHRLCEEVVKWFLVHVLFTYSVFDFQWESGSGWIRFLWSMIFFKVFMATRGRTWWPSFLNFSFLWSEWMLLWDSEIDDPFQHG